MIQHGCFWVLTPFPPDNTVVGTEEAKGTHRHLENILFLPWDLGLFINRHPFVTGNSQGGKCLLTLGENMTYKAPKMSGCFHFENSVTIGDCLPLGSPRQSICCYSVLFSAERECDLSSFSLVFGLGFCFVVILI